VAWHYGPELAIGEIESAAYLRGYDEGKRSVSRVEAFAAIRRAAELAREMEASALIAPDPYDQELWAKARGVRLAIRAAIGSEKS
jgi:hypothetical protein